MANYSKSTNFAVKDSLTTGDPNKIVSGTEIDTEFNSLASMSSTKADKVGGATAGNLASLTASGGIQDSGNAVSDLYGTEDLKTDLDANGDAPIYAVRAWLRRTFSGISASGNIDSLTVLGTGVFRITFTTNMEDADYAIVGTPFGDDEVIAVRSGTVEADKFEVETRDISSGIDNEEFSVVVVR